MPYIEMKSKISKVLGVCKKQKATTRNSCSLSKISGDLESMTAAITHACDGDEKQHPGNDFSLFKYCAQIVDLDNLSFINRFLVSSL